MRQSGRLRVSQQAPGQQLPPSPWLHEAPDENAPMIRQTPLLHDPLSYRQKDEAEWSSLFNRARELASSGPLQHFRIDLYHSSDG
jgi:hypothetical protein